jgi:hypothetical protein
MVKQTAEATNPIDDYLATVAALVLPLKSATL